MDTCQKMLGVRGLFLGLVVMRTLSMVGGEESSMVEVVVEEKRGVRVLVSEDTPTTNCREMLANLEVNNFAFPHFFGHFAASSQNGK